MSKGLGDSIEKFTKVTGIKTIAEAVAKLAGIERCGCDERKQYLNELFPYGKIRTFKVVNDFEFEGKKYLKEQKIKISKEDNIQSYVLYLVRDEKLIEI